MIPWHHSHRATSPFHSNPLMSLPQPLGSWLWQCFFAHVDTITSSYCPYLPTLIGMCSHNSWILGMVTMRVPCFFTAAYRNSQTLVGRILHQKLVPRSKFCCRSMKFRFKCAAKSKFCQMSKSQGSALTIHTWPDLRVNRKTQRHCSRQWHLLLATDLLDYKCQSRPPEFCQPSCTCLSLETVTHRSSCSPPLQPTLRHMNIHNPVRQNVEQLGLKSDRSESHIRY